MNPIKNSIDMVAEGIAFEGMGIKTDYPQLDAALRGLTKGELTLVAGRSSMGKTAFMVDLALNISKTENVGIFSLEMSEHQLIERMISNVQKVSLYDFKSGKVKVNDNTKRDIEIRRMWINDSSGLDITAIVDIINSNREKFGVVCVDYLQLIRSSRQNNPRYLEIDFMVQELRTVAKEKNIAVVLLCQLNREVEKRENHRPRLSDLRESGGIEQTADKILFLYRPSYYLVHEQQQKENVGDTSESYLIIAKNRNGRLEDIPLVWVAEQMSFKPCTFDIDGEF